MKHYSVIFFLIIFSFLFQKQRLILLKLFFRSLSYSFKKAAITLLVFTFAFNCYSQDTGNQTSFSANKRWAITNEGGIAWVTKQNDAHTDHVEMSGKKISVILTYGVDRSGKTVINKKLIFPLLRTIPNNTHASLALQDDFNSINHLLVNGTILEQFPQRFYQEGYLKINSLTNTDIAVERLFYPSSDKAAFIEKNRLKNTGKAPIKIQFPDEPADVSTPKEKGVYGEYILHIEIVKPDSIILNPGEAVEFSVISSARKQTESYEYISSDYELRKRNTFIQNLQSNLVLETPDPVIDKMFEFAKIRLTESIFDTKGGLMHCPGGGPFYAAIWANDQAEYVNPLFPYLGNIDGNESAKNSFRLFSSFMNSEYKPLPSSIISEGVDIWNGAGDRGDQAMIAYGASRFALSYGDTVTAKKLWPLVNWCINYLETKKTAEGVIASDSDELEGRFPAGKINLSTNSLAYGALINASRLANALGKYEEKNKFETNARTLKLAIENYFGANIEGFDTYKYYESNTKLRSWICMPLVMGILDRKEQTANALLSSQLWTENGILTETGSKTFWDRSTLYAFRGLFSSGKTDIALKYLSIYSSKRLLGEHVPYAVEAWPEGNQRHLSAESGLYCRVITEGLFGIEPLGLNTFSINPVLPANWNQMSLKHIRAFNADIEISVKKAKGKERVMVLNRDKVICDTLWSHKSPIIIEIKPSN